jgi:hypothetical protein
MSLIQFFTDNFIVILGAAGMAIAAFWKQIQPLLLSVLNPGAQPVAAMPLINLLLGLNRQPQPQRVDPQPSTLAQDKITAVASITFVIEYFKQTGNSKGESHARNAAKAIFEQDTQ